MTHQPSEREIADAALDWIKKALANREEIRVSAYLAGIIVAARAASALRERVKELAIMTIQLEQENTRLKAEIAGRKEQWRPISEAPFEKNVLGYSSTQMALCYQDVHGWHNIIVGIPQWTPTHFMPLPEPPTDLKEK